MEKTNKQTKNKKQNIKGLLRVFVGNYVWKLTNFKLIIFMQKCEGFRLVKTVLEKDKVGFTWFQNCYKATTIQRDCHYHKDR